MATPRELVAEPLRLGWREVSLVAICVAMLAAFLSRAPIAQDLAYHNFADRRTFCGIPNMLDVSSNLAFLVVGALAQWGTRHLHHEHRLVNEACGHPVKLVYYCPPCDARVRGTGIRMRKRKGARRATTAR